MGTVRTMGSKGQLTVPHEVRKRLGVKRGDRVEFVEQDGFTVLRPAVQNVNDPFAEFVGWLPTFKTVEESTAWVRRMRDGVDDPL